MKIAEQKDAFDSIIRQYYGKILSVISMYTPDGKALAALITAEKERRSKKRILLKTLEDELDKDGDVLDPVLAGNLVDSLYEADAITPPRVTEQEIENVVIRIREGKGRRRIARPGRPRFALKIRRPFRWAAAVCGAALLVFSVNYATARLSGACLVSRIEPRFCCETKYCPCDLKGREKILQ
jgi:hypothetical protein